MDNAKLGEGKTLNTMNFEDKSNQVYIFHKEKRVFASEKAGDGLAVVVSGWVGGLLSQLLPR